MRWLILLALHPAWVRADVTAPSSIRAELRACAGELDAAARTLGGIFADARTEERGDALVLEAEGGWCMHHSSASVTVGHAASHAHAWRLHASEYGWTRTRSGAGLSVEIVCDDRNESESGRDLCADDAFVRAFIRAADACVSRVRRASARAHDFVGDSL